MVLDQSRAALRPVTVVDVRDLSDKTLLCSVDMSTDDAISALLSYRFEHCSIVKAGEIVNDHPQTASHVP
jgi:hypothetical protein